MFTVSCSRFDDRGVKTMKRLCFLSSPEREKRHEFVLPLRGSSARWRCAHSVLAGHSHSSPGVLSGKTQSFWSFIYSLIHSFILLWSLILPTHPLTSSLLTLTVEIRFNVGVGGVVAARSPEEAWQKERVVCGLLEGQLSLGTERHSRIDPSSHLPLLEWGEYF